MTFSQSRVASGFVATLALSAAVAGCGSSSTATTTTPASHMDGSTPMSGSTGTSGMQGATDMGDMPGMDHSTTAQPKMQGMVPLVSGADGTTKSAGGLTLAATHTTFQAGKTSTLVLMVKDGSGKAITSFDRDQTKLMHLIVVRDDFAEYQHVHPTLDPATGEFSIAMALLKPGKYRAIADFTTAGKRYALRADLIAGGGMATPETLPPVAKTASTDGYDIALKDPTLKAGAEASLTFTITKGGQPVTALQSYLGAEGHLVALRDPDLAYSHVHPVGADKAAGAITFSADFPTAAKYRLFLQFRAGDVVHTAAFTVDVTK